MSENICGFMEFRHLEIGDNFVRSPYDIGSSRTDGIFMKININAATASSFDFEQKIEPHEVIRQVEITAKVVAY